MMPRSKNVNTYPEAYWKICERCAVGKEDFQMDVSTTQKALSVQGQFYAFRGALRKEYDEVKKLGRDPAWEAKLKAFVEFSANTVCWVDRPDPHNPIQELLPAKLRFMHRDKTPANEILEQMLATGARSQVQVADDAEKSMKEFLDKVDPKLRPGGVPE
jgi:hypothetical protein